jgi:hypothetical protein
MMRNRRTILGLLAVALLSVATVPFLLRADDPELTMRRRQIAGMSQAERERIDRSFQQFETMSEQERQHLRQFDATLQEDRISNRGRLTETLNTYEQWLKTVTPHQRDALRRESDPARRIALIRDIIESQRSDRIQTRMGSRLEEFLGPIPVLSQKDLLAVMEIIFRKAPVWISAESLRELESYPEKRRPLKLFEMLARKNRTVSELLTETTTRQLLEAISDEQTRRELETVPESGRSMPAARARMLKVGRAIQMSVFAELDREYRRRELSLANLQKFFSTLPPEEQQQLLTLSPEEFRQELRGQFVESEWADSPVLLTLVRQFFRPRPPAGRLPPGSPRGDGRPRLPDRRSPNRN